MSQRFAELIVALCEAAGLPDAQTALENGALHIDGFDVRMHHSENDPDAMYMHFDFGPIATQRVLRVLRLMLESNLTLYAQDQAQLCLDPQTGLVLLTVRVPMGEDIDGAWLKGTCDHYTEHGRYWRDNISNSFDDAFNGLCEGHYMWMKA